MDVVPKPNTWDNSNPPVNPKVDLHPHPISLGWQQEGTRNLTHLDVGLVNIRNSCFLNATLQALFHIPAFLRFLQGDAEHHAACESNGCISCALFALWDVMKSQQVAVPLKMFHMTQAICPRMRRGEQEDAHEYFAGILNALEEQLLERHSPVWRHLDFPSQLTTAVGKIFGGVLKSVVKCPECKADNSIFNPCTTLSPCIEGPCTLQSVLQMKDSEVEYTCRTCKAVLKSATQVESFHTYPKVLVVLLKRFGEDGQKNTSPLTASKSVTVGQAKYKFSAGIIHLGQSMNNGHYICVTLCPNGSFTAFDDSNVHRNWSLNTDICKQGLYVAVLEFEYEIKENKPQPLPKRQGRSLLKNKLEPKLDMVKKPVLIPLLQSKSQSESILKTQQVKESDMVNQPIILSQPHSKSQSKSILKTRQVEESGKGIGQVLPQGASRSILKKQPSLNTEGEVQRSSQAASSFLSPLTTNNKFSLTKQPVLPCGTNYVIDAFLQREDLYSTEEERGQHFSLPNGQQMVNDSEEARSTPGSSCKSTQTRANFRNIGTQTPVKEFKSVGVQTAVNLKELSLSYEKCRRNLKFKFFTGLDVKDFEILFQLLGGDSVIRRLKQKYQLSEITPRYSKVSGRDRLFLFLIRLRRGVPLVDLAEITHLSPSYLGELLYTIMRHIYLVFKSMENSMFPTAAQQEKKKPKPFRPFKKLRIILDGAQFFIQMPTNFQQQGNTYSLYKTHNTVVVVVGISCQGALTFVSPAYEGNMSDKRVVIQSGLLERLDVGDSVMTDRGFDIEGELLDIGVRLYKPPSTGNRNKLTAEEEILTKAIAATRIYVEHIIGDIKDNRLLQGVMPITMLPNIPDYIYIAAYLCNFKESRISDLYDQDNNNRQKCDKNISVCGDYDY